MDRIIQQIMIYLLTILYTVAFVYYSKFQFIETWGGVKGRWHAFGAFMRFIPFLLPFTKATWQDAILAAAISSILFEIGINIIALNKPWNYVGSTAQVDIRFGKYKWWAMGIFLITAIIVKICSI